MTLIILQCGRHAPSTRFFPYEMLMLYKTFSTLPAFEASSVTL